jgi:hypothetical protein
MPVFLIPLVIDLILHLPDLIKAAQQAFSGTPVEGSVKKTLVMDGVSALLAAASKLSPIPVTSGQVQTIIETISELVDSHVATMQPVLNPTLVITGTIEPQKKPG